MQQSFKVVVMKILKQIFEEKTDCDHINILLYPFVPNMCRRIQRTECFNQCVVAIVVKFLSNFRLNIEGTIILEKIKSSKIIYARGLNGRGRKGNADQSYTVLRYSSFLQVKQAKRQRKNISKKIFTITYLLQNALACALQGEYLAVGGFILFIFQNFSFLEQMWKYCCHQRELVILYHTF